MDLPESVACCACGRPAGLNSRKDQSVMMQEDGREVDHPLTTAVYQCAEGHSTQAILYHEDFEFRIQEQPDYMLF